jgi:dTMP kinase
MLGKFITFEGGDGVGKSTQARLLCDYLRKHRGLNVHFTREPGGTENAEKIREILKTSTFDAIAETLLLFAARREHYMKVISPLLLQGYFVICDRFYDSSIVYQGLLKKVDIESVMQLKHMIVGDFEPDLTIILDIDPHVSAKRLMARNLIPDEYDLMAFEKHNLIREGYRKIADVFSFRSVLINANGSEASVLAKILKAMQNYLQIYLV